MKHKFCLNQNNSKLNFVEDEEIFEEIFEEDEAENKSAKDLQKDSKEEENDKNRIIVIKDDIGLSLIDEEVKILKWNKEDKDNNIPIEERKPIIIYVHSYGGDGDVCLSFVDTIQLSKTPIKMVCIGVAMSAAAIIFMAGPKGSRYIFKHGAILIHEGQSKIEGTYQGVVDTVDHYKQFMNLIKGVILENSNIDNALYTKKSKKEWYMYANEAVELGIADCIISDLDEIL